LFVKVCDPVRVTTLESIAKVTDVPDALEVMPVPPINDRVWVFKLIPIVEVPSETFKLTAPIADMF
jgi:hypothetical protein